MRTEASDPDCAWTPSAGTPIAVVCFGGDLTALDRPGVVFPPARDRYLLFHRDILHSWSPRYNNAVALARMGRQTELAFEHVTNRQEVEFVAPKAGKRLRPTELGGRPFRS